MQIFLYVFSDIFFFLLIVRFSTKRQEDKYVDDRFGERSRGRMQMIPIIGSVRTVVLLFNSDSTLNEGNERNSLDGPFFSFPFRNWKSRKITQKRGSNFFFRNKKVGLTIACVGDVLLMSSGLCRRNPTKRGNDASALFILKTHSHKLSMFQMPETWK